LELIASKAGKRNKQKGPDRILSISLNVLLKELQALTLAILFIDFRRYFAEDVPNHPLEMAA
jgi:hypothetical protein